MLGKGSRFLSPPSFQGLLGGGGPQQQHVARETGGAPASGLDSVFSVRSINQVKLGFDVIE